MQKVHCYFLIKRQLFVKALSFRNFSTP